MIFLGFFGFFGYFGYLFNFSHPSFHHPSLSPANIGRFVHPTISHLMHSFLIYKKFEAWTVRCRRLSLIRSCFRR